MNDARGKFGLLLLGIAAIGIIANNRRLNPNIRLIARYAEGDLVQDLETGVVQFIASSLF